jgi:SagB-type dehydrogenase family enzyme
MVTNTSRRYFVTQFAYALWGFFFSGSFALKTAGASIHQDKEGLMKLPDPQVEGNISLEQTISARRTIRSFSNKSVSLSFLSQMLWAAHGITGPDNFKRSAPSAGALYPMDLYAAVGQNAVKELDAGVYHYHPKGHAISKITEGDQRLSLAEASLHQMWMAAAPINFIITAEYPRITGKYGRRGLRYAQIEAGHIGQNLFLQAVALGGAAGIVGAYHDHKVINVLRIPESHEPLLIMPVGYKG